jgi:hypothetical protein
VAVTHTEPNIHASVTRPSDRRSGDSSRAASVAGAGVKSLNG